MERPKRLNRDQFFARLEALEAGQLRAVLWDLYWRGAATLRERIEDALLPKEARPRKPAADEEVDGPELVDSVAEFVRLALSGAYLGGTREVSRRERSQWRLTFRRLVDDAGRLLGRRDLEHGAPAMEQLIQLACECRGYNYFRSEDPVEAMKLVVSDQVRLLWQATLDGDGFRAFVSRAAPQLVRWESPFGWTRTGFTSVAQKERTLASEAKGMLKGIDAWIAFVDAYLAALDALARPASPGDGRRARAAPWDERDRQYRLAESASRLAEWHGYVLDQLTGSDAEDRVDRLTRHLALGGPEVTFLQARWAARQGDATRARNLATRCLTELPGHQGFLRFAQTLDAPLPARTRELMAQQKAQQTRGRRPGDDAGTDPA